MIESARTWFADPRWQVALDFVEDYAWTRVVLILLAAAILAKLCDWLITRWLMKWTAKTVTDLDDRIIEGLHRPVFLSFLFVGALLALQQLDLPPLIDLVSHRTVVSLVLVTWVIFALRISHVLLDGLSRLEKRTHLIQPKTVPLFEVMLRIVLWGAAIYFLLQTWGIDVAAWMVSAGVVGIAVGFAAKDTLANLFAGIFILADAPYSRGDFVVLDSGQRGEVTDIGLRSTRLLTRDDIEVTVPNAIMGNTTIINESGGPSEMERVRVPVSVAYGSDVDEVRDLLDSIARNHPDIVESPEPRVRFRTFGASGLDFELLGWIAHPVLRGRVKDSLNTQIYKAFSVAKIEIPYPKRDVYLHTPAAEPAGDSG